MVRRVRFLSLAVVSLLAVSCRNAGSDREVRRSALEFPTGGLRGTVSWKGAPISGLDASGVGALIPGIGYASVDANGTYEMPSLAPGTYELQFLALPLGCPSFAEIIGRLPVTIAAGVTAVGDVDLTSSAGHVTATITANGLPVPKPWISVGGVCADPWAGDPWAADGAGNVSHFIAPGSYTARVFREGNMLGSLPFAVVTGQELSLGVRDFSTGSIRGTVLWKGTPVADLRAKGMRALIRTVATGEVAADGAYQMLEVAPGSYTLIIESPGCARAAEKLAEVPIVVTAGAQTLADVELEPSAGLVTGTITSNGVPVGMPAIHILDFCGGAPWPRDDAGHFTFFAAPGSYTATVMDVNGIWGHSVLGTFPFTVTAGQESDLGAIDFPTGEVRGTVVWNGAPVRGLPTEGMQVIIPGVSHALLGPDGTFHLRGIPAGLHDAEVRSPGCPSQPAEKVGAASVTVTAGAVTTILIDTTASAGLVTGAITVNGSPLLSPSIKIEKICWSNAWATDAAGRFAHFLAPGAHDAAIRAPGTLDLIGTMAFGVQAGKTTDVDIQTTPVGTDVHVDVNGGVGTVNGLSLDFAQVTTPGNTTVVQSGFGPPPPTGFEIVGGRYWDIDTTALHTGAIIVCIQYDEMELQGDEADVRLVHDEGAGFVDITTSRDPAANVVCGMAMSLSPFAVVEPASTDTAPPVWSGVPARLVAYATSTAGAKVTYALPTALDAVDGATPVTCTPAPGARFPVGQTAVACTTIDAAGNANATSFGVKVQYQAPADGTFFGPPLKADGSATFKRNSTIPVKFRLTGASAGITNLVARLHLARTSNGVAGTIVEPSSNAAPDGGNVFRYDGAGQYIYNLSTKPLAVGKWLLEVDLGDGAPRQIAISLR
jgi:hypothetical protein